MMLAQALIEHSLLSSMAASIQRISSEVESFVGTTNGKIAAAALVVFALMFLLRSR
jgi:predicted PurR-regulated permease PerM